VILQKFKEVPLEQRKTDRYKFPYNPYVAMPPAEGAPAAAAAALPPNPNRGYAGK
jgi:hypothetical protein